MNLVHTWSVTAVRLILALCCLSLLPLPRSRAVLHHQHPEEPAGAERHPRSQEAAGRGGGAAGPAERHLEADFQTTVGDPCPPSHLL